jgi:ATP-binding cassette subfamily C protein
MAHETGAERLARAALRHRLPDFAAVGVFSSAVNILMLTGSIYMLEVYDRVLVSRSVETLVVLSLMALLAFGLQGGLDMLRSRILARIGAQIDAELAPAVYRAATLLPLTGAPAGEALAPARDAETLRSFLSSNGPLGTVRHPVPADLPVRRLPHSPSGRADGRTGRRHHHRTDCRHRLGRAQPQR